MQKDNAWADRPVKDYYHYYSDGTICPVLFACDRDFIFGMNLAAALSFKFGVKVLCICLLGNHFHMLIKGPREACLRFSRYYQASLVRRLPEARSGTVKVTMDPISDETELMSVFAYVRRNCISAGFQYLPSVYPWGAGEIFFRPPSSFDHGTPLRNFPVRARPVLLRTNVRLPDHWEVDGNGMVLTSFWIDWAHVNEIFQTPARYIAFMHQKKDLESTIRRRCSRRLIDDLSQKELHRKAASLSASMVGKSLNDCSLEEKLLVADRLWSDHVGYSPKSIARALRLDPEVLALFLK